MWRPRCRLPSRRSRPAKGPTRRGSRAGLTPIPTEFQRIDVSGRALGQDEMARRFRPRLPRRVRRVDFGGSGPPQPPRSNYSEIELQSECAIDGVSTAARWVRVCQDRLPRGARSALPPRSRASRATHPRSHRPCRARLPTTMPDLWITAPRVRTLGSLPSLTQPLVVAGCGGPQPPAGEQVTRLPFRSDGVNCAYYPGWGGRCPSVAPYVTGREPGAGQPAAGGC